MAPTIAPTAPSPRRQLIEPTRNLLDLRIRQICGPRQRLVGVHAHGLKLFPDVLARQEIEHPGPVILAGLFIDNLIGRDQCGVHHTDRTGNAEHNRDHENRNSAAPNTAYFRWHLRKPPFAGHIRPGIGTLIVGASAYHNAPHGALVPACVQARRQQSSAFASSTQNNLDSWGGIDKSRRGLKNSVANN